MRFMMATKRAAADHGLAKAAGDFPETRYWIGKTRVLSMISAIRGAPIRAGGLPRRVPGAGTPCDRAAPGQARSVSGDKLVDSCGQPVDKLE